MWLAFDIAVIAAAIIAIPALVLGDSNDPASRRAAAVLDWVSWSVFAAEFVARLAFDPARRSWLPSEWFMVAITVVTFPVLPAGLGVLRLARLSRLLRLLRLLLSCFTCRRKLFNLIAETRSVLDDLDPQPI